MNSVNNFHCVDSFMNFKMTSDVTNLHRLRYHLAIEGCTDSQLSLAKSFLQEATNSDTERRENSELAVRWLLLATGQGNKEAQVLLESCYQMGVGITVHTRSEVEACLKSTPTEKLAQQIGNSVFRLSAYDVHEPVPLEYFKYRIYQYLNNLDISDRSKVILPVKLTSSICLTVKDLVTAIHQCLSGENPSISLNSICALQFNSQPSKFSRVYRFNNIFLTCYDHFIDELSKMDVSLALTVVGFAFIIMGRLISIMVYFIQYKHVVLVSELLLVCLCFALMVSSSSKIIKQEKERDNVNMWFKVIDKFEPKLQKNIPKLSSLPSVMSAIVFLFSSFILESAYCDIDLSIFPRLFFPISCFLIWPNWNRSNQALNILVILSLLLAVTKVQLNSVSPTFLLGFPMPYFYDIDDLLAKIMSISAILVYINVLIFSNFSSSLGCLVITIWIHFFVKNVTFSNLNIVYSLSIWICVILIHKKVGLYTAFTIACIVDQLFFGTNLLLAVVCVAIFLPITKISSYVLLIVSNSRLFKMYTMVFIVIFAVLPPICSITELPLFNTVQKKNVTWSQYSKHCHHTAWSETNMAKTQVFCDRFKGYSMIFEGTVSHVKLISSLSWYVPNFLKHTDKFYESIFDGNVYEIVAHKKGTFRTEAELSIQVTNVCKEFVLQLREGDILNIEGVLEHNIGTTSPVLLLEHADCISCFESINCHIEKFSFLDFIKPRVLQSLRCILYPWSKEITF